MTEAMYLSKVQWAAVSTCLEVRMEPPQNGVFAPVKTMAACGSYDFVKSHS